MFLLEFACMDCFLPEVSGLHVCAENTTGIKEKVIKITIIKIRLQI